METMATKLKEIKQDIAADQKMIFEMSEKTISGTADRALLEYIKSMLDRQKTMVDILEEVEHKLDRPLSVTVESSCKKTGAHITKETSAGNRCLMCNEIVS